MIELELDVVQQGRRNRYAARLGFAAGDTALRLDWIDDQDQRFGVHQLSDGTLVRPEAAALRGWLQDYSLSEVFDKGSSAAVPDALIVVVEGHTEEAFV